MVFWHENLHVKKSPCWGFFFTPPPPPLLIDNHYKTTKHSQNRPLCECKIAFQPIKPDKQPKAVCPAFTTIFTMYQHISLFSRIQKLKKSIREALYKGRNLTRKILDYSGGAESGGGKKFWNSLPEQTGEKMRNLCVHKRLFGTINKSNTLHDETTNNNVSGKKAGQGLCRQTPTVFCRRRSPPRRTYTENYGSSLELDEICAAGKSLWRSFELFESGITINLLCLSKTHDGTAVMFGNNNTAFFRRHV
jgi:hypothetical protein